MKYTHMIALTAEHVEEMRHAGEPVAARYGHARNLGGIERSARGGLLGELIRVAHAHWDRIGWLEDKLERAMALLGAAP